MRFVGAILAVLALAAAAPPDTPFRDLKPDTGWSEAVVSVSDLDRTIRYFVEVAGWTVRARADTPRAVLALWGLPPTATAREALVCNAGDEYGCVRLIRFAGVAQAQMRPSAMPWDTGGVFSLMTRARDLRAAYDRAVALGYGGFSEPTRFDYQGVHLSNVVLRGPDGVNIAIYQRDAPALTGWATITKLSSPFNAMQTVRDRDAARDFYVRVFGYGVLANADFVDAAPGPNNFAVPQNMVTTLPRRHAILGIGVNGLANAAGNRQVEMMQFVGLSGRDLAATDRFPNFGTGALRFPTHTLGAHIARARAGGYTVAGPVMADVPGWGQARVADITSPDGTINELIEIADGTPALRAR